MKRKMMAVILSMALLFSMSSLTFAAESSKEVVEDVAPRIAISYQKTVTRTYQNFSSVPESIYYSEFSDAYKTTCSGTLNLVKVIAIGTSYQATFKGTLHGNI